MKSYLVLLATALIFLYVENINAQNPIIHNQFTADPSARVFGDSVYLYPSHDIVAKEGQGRPGWFCMEDYHVFSSPNLTSWTDNGMILSQYKVDWVDSTKFSMWAPDCIFKNGKYYFYFPSILKDTVTYGKGFGIGVAVSDKPYGPFVPETKPIANVHGIDPCPFIDKDGQAYLYWSARNIFVAKLKNNMTELASEPKLIDSLPEKGLKEGPFVFERNGIYYLTYPHVQNKTERLEYATSSSPLGPFKVAGVMMDESAHCWTNHQSVVNFKGQWYLFYHHNDYSPDFDKNRSARIDSLFFNSDGTIQKVTPTLRGVGLIDASSHIQIDRYNEISKKGASIDFNDKLNTFKGWKTVLKKKNSWVRYNAVDFGNKSFTTVVIKALSKRGANLQISLKNGNKPIISQVKISGSKDWQITKVPLTMSVQGIQDLIISLKNSKSVEIDWISFE